MPRPQTRSDHTILEATRAILMERGPAVPISEIARAVGLSAPAILGRFGSRGALVQAALIPPSLSPVLAAILVELGPPDHRRQLRTTLTALGTWLTVALPRNLVVRTSPPDLRPLPGAVSEQPRLQPTLTIWLARGQARGLVVDGAPQRLAAISLLTLSGHAMASWMDATPPDPDLAAVVDGLVQLLAADPS